ncbi:MAG: acid phosphatasa protein [Gemmatimonadetes bacterium]|nr:acid phosphatasa protein [Gemmatimonadota bacterium]
MTTDATPGARRPAPARPVSGATLAGAAVVLVVAVGVFSRIARRVASKEAEPVDQALRDRLQEHRSAALDVAVKPVTLLSLPILVVTATGALVWHLHRTGRPRAAVAIGVAPVIAAVAGQSFTTFLHQRNPPDASDAPHGEVTEPSFPSGHTTGVTAEALAIAFVLASEGLASGETLAALLVWPLLVGVTRVYRDRHWLSDILGGWAAGTGVAAASVLLYGALAKPEPDAV